MTIYPKSIEECLESRQDKYIPRKLNKDEHLRLYKRYFQLFQNVYFKVIDVYNVEDIEYYTIRYHESLIGEISYPLDNSTTYEMMIDKHEIANLDNMINVSHSYTGAEIKYWFYSHNIDLSSDQYIGFASFIISGSKNEISDDKYYYLKAIKDNNIYRKCRCSSDRMRNLRR